MKSILTTLSAVLMLASVEGIVFDLGPFSMQFGGYSRAYRVTHQNVLDRPICYSIENRNQLELTLEVYEKVSNKEQKVITKRLVIEPYAFGVSEDDKPILQGNVVKEELIKEVTIKYGEDQFDESNTPTKSNEKGMFSGLFSSTKIKDLDISKVIHISIIPDAHFEAPKNFKGLDEKNTEIICQLPVVK